MYSNSQNIRRKLVKSVIWATPVITTVTLPAHASTTATTAAPTPIIVTTAAPTTTPAPEFNLSVLLNIRATTDGSGYRVFLGVDNGSIPVPAGTSIFMETNFGSGISFTYDTTATSLPGISPLRNAQWMQAGPERFQYIGPEISAFGFSYIGWIGTPVGALPQTITLTLQINDANQSDNTQSVLLSPLPIP